MKTRYSLVLLILCAGLRATLGQGTAFTYQGRLVNNATPANGSYDLSFSLFNTNTDGTLFAGPITNTATPVTGGLFTVTLDFGAGVFNGTGYWLDISVRTNGSDAFTALTPRQPVLPAPYAVMAASASNLLGSLPASQLSGAIPPANLSGTYGGAVSFNNPADAFTGQFSGDGGGLSNLNASQLSSGTVPNARLAGNVAFLDSNQMFTAQNVFAQGIGIGNPNPSPIMALDVLAGQAVARFVTTNAGNGSVIELRNLLTNANELLGAINFNNNGSTYPGQIGYVAANPTNQNNDYFEFRVGGTVGLVLQADSRGLGAASLIGGYPLNSVSPINSGGDVIAGGGYGGGYNLVLSNTSGVFIGAGSANHIGPNLNDSAIVGGYGNTVQDWDSAIVGGAYNAIQPGGGSSFLGGGGGNTLASPYSIIGGGYYNSIPTNATQSYIGGGTYNMAAAPYSAIVGGYDNLIEAGDGNGGNFIGNGYYNKIAAKNLNSAIGGGSQNQIYGYNSHSTIGGGFANSIQGYDYWYTNGSQIASTIAGGADNAIQYGAQASAIGGGVDNLVSTGAGYAAISGGYGNTAGGMVAAVPGGYLNVANGMASFAAGTYAHANHDGSFVLADLEYTDFSSTADNQLSARFGGGVRFETYGAGMTLDGQQVLAGTVNSGQLSGNYGNIVNFNNAGDSFAGSFSGSFNGNFNGNFNGSGAGLTNLNASQLISGTVPGPSLGGSYPSAVTFGNAANSFTGNGGGLTGLNASQLTSGAVPSAALSGTYGNALTLNNSGNSFTGSGAGLTGLNASQLTSGTVPKGALSGPYTNAVSLTNAANSFAGNGGGLTGLNAGQLTSGTLPAAAFSGTYGNAVTLSNPGNSFSGSGGGLTGLSASQLTSGTVPSSALAGLYSGAVTMTNPANAFAGNGTGLTNVNAATLNSLASSAFASASGSSSYIQNQSASPQTASLNISGNATVGGSVSSSSLTVSNATAGNFALTNGGSLKVAGAGVGTSTAAFVQLSAPGNISGDSTIINNPLCNGDPNAILLITHNYNPGGSGVTTLYNKHVGVYYTGFNWAIYNEDVSNMSTNIAFNVLIIKH